MNQKGHEKPVKEAYERYVSEVSGDAVCLGLCTDSLVPAGSA